MRNFIFLIFNLLLLSCNADNIVTIDVPVWYQTKAICEQLQIDCKRSELYGKSVAVFGGSVSVAPESEGAKLYWRQYMGWNITDYGIGGYGFSSLQGSIQDEVNNAGFYDIYILWASTNDFNGNRIVGDFWDYSGADSFNAEKLMTQCGGINYCIDKIREKNPQAVILFFISLPFFSRDSGYNTESLDINSVGNRFNDYIEAQMKCCRNKNVSYLNQFVISEFTLNNINLFYKSDRLHLTEEGYKHLAYYQLKFFLICE